MKKMVSVLAYFPRIQNMSKQNKTVNTMVHIIVKLLSGNNFNNVGDYDLAVM